MIDFVGFYNKWNLYMFEATNYNNKSVIKIGYNMDGSSNDKSKEVQHTRRQMEK